MSTYAQLAPDAWHPAWCNGRDCGTDLPGSPHEETYHVTGGQALTCRESTFNATGHRTWSVEFVGNGFEAMTLTEVPVALAWLEGLAAEAAYARQWLAQLAADYADHAPRGPLPLPAPASLATAGGAL